MEGYGSKRADLPMMMMMFRELLLETRGIASRVYHWSLIIVLITGDRPFPLEFNQQTLI
jgi:hypothetical protein